MIAVVDGQVRDLSWLSASAIRGITDDGRTIVFEDVSDAPGAARSVWVRTVDGAPAMRLGDGRPLAIAADGKWVAATITGPPARLVSNRSWHASGAGVGCRRLPWGELSARRQAPFRCRDAAGG